MDEGDEYVPQISQMDYSLMEPGGYNSGGMSNGSGLTNISYYEGAPNNANSLTSLQQMTNMYGEASTSGGPQHPMSHQMMPPQGRPPPHPQMDPHMAMPNIPPQAMAPPPAAPPTKAKSRSRSKKNAANSADGAPPTQQPLPPSYQMMGPGSGGGPVQNPAMMGQMRPPPHMAGQYEAAYWHQQGQMPHGNFPTGQIPNQGPPQAHFRQPVPQQYGTPYQQIPPQQGYPGYPPHMQMQQQQQHPYYGQQPHPAGGYPHQYPGGMPPQGQQQQPPRYGAPGPGGPQNPQQQYYVDPNMQAYYQQGGYPPGGGGVPPGYPQAAPGKPVMPQGQNAAMQQSAYPQQQGKTDAGQNQGQAAMSPHYRMQPNQPSQNPPQNEWSQRGYPPSAPASSPYYPQQMTPQQQQQYQELQAYQMEFEKLRNQPQRTPEIMQRAEQLQQKMGYIKAQLQQASQPAMMPPQQPPQQRQHQPQMPQYPQQPQMHGQGGPGPGPGPMMNSTGYPQNNAGTPAQSQMPPGNMQISMQGASRETAPSAASSVAVMQTAPNQVQVNITPEAPCRTLISVYHQYPAPNVSTNVTIPSLSASGEYLNTTVKDSIPPEPIPSSMVKKEQEARQQQQQQHQATLRQPEYQSPQPQQSVHYQQPLQQPYQNISNTYQSSQANLDSMTSISTPVSAPNQKVITPPPPQPVPSMTTMSNDTYFSRTSSESSLTNHTNTSLKSSSRTMSRDSIPPPNIELKMNKDETPIQQTQEESKKKSTSRRNSTISTETVESLPPKYEPPPVIEPFAVAVENSYPEEFKIEKIENSMAVEKVPEKEKEKDPDPEPVPAQVEARSPSPEKESEQMLELEVNHVGQEEEEKEEEAPEQEKEVNEDETEPPVREPTPEPEKPQEDEPTEKPQEDEPIEEPQEHEPTPEIEVEKKETEPEPEPQAPRSVSAASSTSTAPMKMTEETPSEQPDVSVDDSKLTTEVDEESIQVDEEQEEPEEPETPEKPKKKRGRQPKAAAEGGSEKRGRKPRKPAVEKPEKPAKAGRKRKKDESETYEPEEEDQEFVPQPTKRGKKRKVKEVVKEEEEEEEFPPAVEIEPNLEEFVEKRRSGRKKAEKRSYVDKEMDFELEDEPLIPKKGQKSRDEQRVVEINVDEWIVDKILGVRTAKRMVKRKKAKETNGEEQHPSTSNITTETNGEKVAETNGETEKSVEKPQESDLSDEPKIEPMETEETPSTSNEPNNTEPQPEAEIPKEEEEKEENPEDYEEVEAEVEEIFVKFKNRSYLHCMWKSVEELEELDKRILGKINRFKAKNNIEAMIDEDEYFNEDYTQVERVLDESVDEETGENYAFVKWRSLSYEDCTWELFKDVPESKIEEFRKRNNTVDSYKVKERLRPSSRDWQKLPDDKEWKDGNTLRDYQFEGVNWLLFCWYNKQNCILADEMGLGKTVQTITFLQEIYDQGIHGPFLIVVPLSTLHNWEREFETWTDINAVVYHGSAQSREIIQQYELFYPEDPDARKKKVVKFDVLITTYEMVVSDCETLSKFKYRVCVIDEAHRIKNRNCKLLTGGLLAFRMEHRVLLTGTPLQNNVQELFSLLNFLEPTQFSNSDAFLEQFGQCQTEEQVQKLQEILKPMMLRRLKEDVEKTLQPKEETIIEVQLSNIQKKYYRAILERNFKHLLKGASAPSLMNTMMELRKCCNHPFLINGAEEQILQELKQAHPDKHDDEIQLNGLIESSGKLVLINKLLPKLHQDGHKVLIFSQMVRVLDIIAEFLDHMNYQYERIDGNVRGDLRQMAIDRFCKPDSEKFVFLLCTRAGGLGINLTAADTVIIFDSDWNPQNDLQAQARCHRIGQTKMVKVYRLITANTYEREMFDKASLKLGLDKAVLQSMAPSTNNQQLSRKEVEDLLRKGAYGAVMDEDNEGSKFSEEDIETILQRRTQTIRLEPGIKGSTFAKASFTSSNNREDIDVNDPNFWSKWAKKANIDVDAGENELIVSEPRNRRKRFEENVFKDGGQSEEGDGTDDDTGSGTRTPRGNGTKNDNVSKNRSGKKRRMREEDDDYITGYMPDEFAFNKSEFFKVEKLLNTWGWGRWKLIKEKAELSISESDIEHISRTLLLCCIREYKLDERIREFIWALITPSGGAIGKGGKKGVIGGGLYHEGWAALPEYNPPAFAVDSSFQRHVQRHANKLLTRVYHLQILYRQVIVEKEADIMEQDKAHNEIQLSIPMIGDPPTDKWDIQCDKSFLIGIFKHGMENYEAIRTDPKLVFLEKGIEQFPTTIELNTRFKRLVLVLQRQADSQTVKKWPPHEQAEFMRILRNYGVKDDPTSANVINWGRFRELSTTLTKKTDSEMLEQLYCVLAMCTKQQGGELSAVDQKRASSVEPISARKAEKLMNRLHLMRKIHAIITTGIHNVKNSLKLCSTEAMPSGWSDVHDEQLLIVVDKWGLENIGTRTKQLPAFQKIIHPDEKTMLRRVVEICTTIETGRWNGTASIDMIEDDDLDLATTQMIATLQRTLATGSPRSSQARRGRSRKDNLIPGLTGKASTSSTASMQQAVLNDYTQLLGLAASSSNLSQAQQLQQLQQLQALFALSGLAASVGATTATSSLTSNTTSKSTTASILATDSDALNLSKKDTPKNSVVTSTKSASAGGSGVGGSGSSGGGSAQTNASAVQNPLTSLSFPELLALSALPKETNIHVVHSETGVRLTGDKAPKLKHLEQWLIAHSKYKVDLNSMFGLSTNSTNASSTSAKTTPSATPAKSAVVTKASTTATSVLSTPIASTSEISPGGGLEPGEIPKPKATTATPATDPTIGVFHRLTGITMQNEKCPTLTNLAAWLDKNPDYNVQTTHGAIAKATLPKIYESRIGGESNTLAGLANSTSNATQSSSSSSSAALNAAAMELQMQMLLQQTLMSQMIAAAGYNQYGALLGAGSSGGTSGTITSSANNVAGMDAATLAALSALGVPMTTGSTSSTSNKTSSLSSGATASSNASSAQAMAEAALAAELMATMLNPTAMAMSSLQPYLSMDMATLTGLSQLSALTGTSSSALTPVISAASNATTPVSIPTAAATPTPASSTPQAGSNSATPLAAPAVKKSSGNSSATKGKLDAVVEKLASSTSSNPSS